MFRIYKKNKYNVELHMNDTNGGVHGISVDILKSRNEFIVTMTFGKVYEYVNQNNKSNLKIAQCNKETIYDDNSHEDGLYNKIISKFKEGLAFYALDIGVGFGTDIDPIKIAFEDTIENMIESIKYPESYVEDDEEDDNVIDNKNNIGNNNNGVFAKCKNPIGFHI